MSLRGSVATAAISCLHLLAACGDSGSTKGTEPDEEVGSADVMAETFADLPVCVDKRDGATAYVKDEKTAYICTDGDWTPDSDDNGSFSGDILSSSSSVVNDSDESRSSNKSRSSDKEEVQSSSSSLVTSSLSRGLYRFS